MTIPKGKDRKLLLCRCMQRADEVRKSLGTSIVMRTGSLQSDVAGGPNYITFKLLSKLSGYILLQIMTHKTEFLKHRTPQLQIGHNNKMLCPQLTDVLLIGSPKTSLLEIKQQQPCGSLLLVYFISSPDAQCGQVEDMSHSLLSEFSF